MFLAASMLLMAALPATAQDDPRCIEFAGVALEGHADSVDVALRAAGFTPWGQSDDGDDRYYRGHFYGIRAKLMVSTAPPDSMVQSAYITVGPYSTESMLKKNHQYFLYKLQQEYGTFEQIDGAWVFMDDYGSIKLSVVDNDNGSRDIRVLFFNDMPFYKDAITMGFHDAVQDVVTDNAIAEEQFMRFAQNGQMEMADLGDRHYDRYGYMTTARMAEAKGYSTVEYAYDSHKRLVRRTLSNNDAGISYINEYSYNDTGDILSQNQKVYDKNHECIMTITMLNNYLTRDSHGNWTSNSVTLTYWEKGQQSQRSTVLQKRTLTYWDE